MPAPELTEAEIDDLVAYLDSLRMSDDGGTSIGTPTAHDVAAHGRPDGRAVGRPAGTVG